MDSIQVKKKKKTSRLNERFDWRESGAHRTNMKHLRCQLTPEIHIWHRLKHNPRVGQPLSTCFQVCSDSSHQYLTMTSLVMDQIGLIYLLLSANVSSVRPITEFTEQQEILHYTLTHINNPIVPSQVFLTGRYLKKKKTRFIIEHWNKFTTHFDFISGISINGQLLLKGRFSFGWEWGCSNGSVRTQTCARTHTMIQCDVKTPSALGSVWQAERVTVGFFCLTPG